MLIPLLLFLGSAHAGPRPARTGADMSLTPENRPFTAIAAETAQVLVATPGTSGANSITLHFLERRADGWGAALPSAKAVIGRSGFAEPGMKREGDGRTPSGVYPLTLAFGYSESVNTKMPYRMAGDNDIWIDDPDAPDYNTWGNRGKTRARSFEDMRRKDGLYRYGLVIGYNMDPVLRGYGSAIFLHVWKGPGSPTTGCVAMAEKDVLRVLRWLDPARKPLIIMGSPDNVLKLTE